MHRLLDILASGIHDTKNQLFSAESLVAASEAEQQIDLSEVRYAIESAANRLSRTLAAYQLMRHGAQLAIVPAIVPDLCAEVALAQKHHLANNGITLTIDCQALDDWPLDRDLVTDMLNNAVQNAGRVARREIRLSAFEQGNELVLRVEDDGPGFSTIPPAGGTGLIVAEKLAELHVRQHRHGSLKLSNGGTLGGACFELRLP
ncbi:MAG: HAMP domain-containing histidine kinase [Betaproteobacteria bacterium]|nr:HAMP domain-containing histidine kinase [Betaproteobacteria bacterium]